MSDKRMSRGMAVPHGARVKLCDAGYKNGVVVIQRKVTFTPQSLAVCKLVENCGAQSS